jgi:chemotaxis protein methyltransferase WspC
LIYFDRPTQRKALAHISQFLNPTGILFVGAAEQPWVLEHGFAPANIPMAFACRKAPFRQALAADQRARSLNGDGDRNVWSGPAVHNGSPAPLGNATLPGSTIHPPGEAPLTQLEVARRLADAGQLDEASAICHKHLRESGASAQAYYLLGLLCDAAGDPGALEFYRKALYLEPNHYETLLQMALWSQKNGDAARARTYKNRAQRLKNQKPANS